MNAKMLKFSEELKQFCDDVEIEKLSGHFCSYVACTNCHFWSDGQCLFRRLIMFSQNWDKIANPLNQFTNEQLVEELNRRLVK